MLHACVEKFDMTGTVGKILGTKPGLTYLMQVTTRFTKKIKASGTGRLGAEPAGYAPSFFSSLGNPLGVFSSRKVREKIVIACFSFIWQLLSNYRVISYIFNYI